MNSKKAISDQDQERLDILIDYLESEEWIIPVQSFIDYYCVVFATKNKTEHIQEKQRVYDEYKSVVGGNLNYFTSSILQLNGDQLADLLLLYNGDYDCLEYVLAVEDYEIFHNFMYETNLDLDQQVKLKL